MRGVANDINQLKLDRIAKIERDMEGFARSVTELVNAVAPELAGEQPEDAVRGRLEKQSRMTSLLKSERRCPLVIQSVGGVHAPSVVKKARTETSTDGSIVPLP